MIKEFQLQTRTILKMPISCDLVETSFKEALKLLAPDLPLMLVCSEYSVDEIFGRWLWDNSRVTCISFAPKEILKHENSWALYGCNKAVYSEGF